MTKLTDYLKRYWFSFFIAIIAMIISISLDMLAPQITRHIIDEVIVGGKLELLSRFLIGILIVGVGRCIFQYIKEFLFDLTGSKISSEIRKNLFFHIQGLSMDFFDRNSTGVLMARVKDDVDRIWDALSYVGMLLLEVIIHTSIVLYCMFQLNWKLALLPAVIMPVMGVIAIFMEKKLSEVYEEISQENAELNTVAEENLEGVRTVKAFAREKFEIGKFLAHNNRYYELNMRQSKVFVKYYPMFQIITKLLPIVVVILGGMIVMKGQMSLGELGAFTEYSMNIVWPMEMLGWLTNSISAAIASNKKLQKIYEEKPSVQIAEHPVSLQNIKGDISFEGVGFHKEDDYPILTDISFHVKAGQTVGIMGTTGAGKTSIINLLQRFYDTTEGTIRLDGVDIRQLSPGQLRSNIALVMQDIFLFSDTIKENMGLGNKKKINHTVITEAAENAQARDFIERMDEQYETVIGERGVGLSGGQKQRISIARALAKHTPVLVLDDSTSALDMETEQLIQQTLNSLENTTKIIIAHRISSVRNADEIIVLENGKIIERGKHGDLMKKKGIYFQTYELQYGTMRKEVS